MEPRFGAITATDRLDQFIEFCDSWFEGDKSRRNLRNLDIDAALQGCPIEIPSTLVQFYWAARNWPWKRAFSRGQDHLLGPAEIGRDNPMAEHGLLLIARENQGVTEWACELDGSDPAVYDVEGEVDVGDSPNRYPFARCSNSLVDFLINMQLFEIHVHQRIVRELGPLDRHIATEPEDFELLAVNEAEGVQFGLFAGEVLVLRSGTSCEYSVRSQQHLDLLRPWAGEVIGCNLNLSIESERQFRRMSLRMRNDESAEMMYNINGVKRTTAVQMPWSFDLIQQRLRNNLIADEGDPRLHLRVEGAGLLHEVERPRGGQVDPLVAGEFYSAVVDQLHLEREVVAAERAVIECSDLDSWVPFVRDCPQLETDFSLVGWAGELVDSTWIAHRAFTIPPGRVKPRISTGQVRFWGDGTWESWMETGIWRVAGDELFLKGDENPECIAVLRRQQSLLEGESQSLQPPFTVGPCTFRLLDPLPTPTGAEADIVGTSWEWETKNYLIEFFAGGNLRLSVEAKKHSSPFTEYGSWDLEATTLSLKLGLTSASFPIDLAIAQAATLVGTSVSPGESGVKVELVRRGG